MADVDSGLLCGWTLAIQYCSMTKISLNHSYNSMVFVRPSSWRDRWMNGLVDGQMDRWVHGWVENAWADEDCMGG